MKLGISCWVEFRIQTASISTKLEYERLYPTNNSSQCHLTCETKYCPHKNKKSRKIRFLSFGGDVSYILLQNSSLWGSFCVEIWSKQFLPAWRTHARTSVQLGVRAPLEQYFSYICVHHQKNFACPLCKIRFVRKCRVFLNSDVFPVL